MHIYKNAKKVMLWIGEDGHYEDSLAFYLGRGIDASMKASLDLAVTSSQCSKSEAAKLIKETTPELAKPRWCYLENLLYQP
jgi:hypothetical protein